MWQRIRLDPIIKNRHIKKGEWVIINPEETKRAMILTMNMPIADREKLLNEIGVDNRPENVWIVHKLPGQSGYWISVNDKKNTCNLL